MEPWIGPRRRPSSPAATGRRHGRGDAYPEDVEPAIPDDRLGVERRLRTVQTHGDQGLDGVGGPLDLDTQIRLLGNGEVGQQEVGRLLPARRKPDPDPYAEVVAPAPRATDRLEPVVPVVPAPELDPD